MGLGEVAMAPIGKLLYGATFACALVLRAGCATAEPQNGWWWNPNESGRGFFLEVAGGVMYLAGYFYESDGRATWASSGGPVADPYSYKGTLQSFRNGQSVFGAYRLPDTITDIGPISVTFDDDTHGTITWPGGTIVIERDIFGEQPDPDFEEAPVLGPKTGWWWNPAESGSGYSVEIQGDNAFVVGFMYDDAGNPIWYFTAGPMASPTHFEGDWLQFSGGQTLTGAYQAPTPGNLGRVTIDFASTDDATITFDDGQSAELLPKRGRTSRLQPQITGPIWATNDYWPRFTCSANQKIKIVDGGFTQTETYTYTLDFRRLGIGTDYEVEGSSSFNYTFQSSDTQTGCTKNGSYFASGILGKLTIEPNLNYHGKVYGDLGYETDLLEVCPDGSFHWNKLIPVNFSLGSYQTFLQNPRPYPPSAPVSLPFMKASSWAQMSDGSRVDWGWYCLAGV
jgi:hypothetical protein